MRAVHPVVVPEGYLEERGADVRVYDRTAARWVHGPSHVFEGVSDPLIVNGVCRFWVGPGEMAPHVVVQTLVDGVWTDVGVLSFETSLSDRVREVRARVVSPDRCVLGLVTDSGTVLVSLVRGARAPTIQHGSGLEVAGSRYVRWRGVPPGVTDVLGGSRVPGRFGSGYHVAGSGVEHLLTSYWKAEDYSGAGNLLDGTGNGRDAVLPAAPNKPLWLPYGGVQHLRLPGAGGNYASTPHAAAMNVTDLDIRVERKGTWRPTGTPQLVGKEDTNNRTAGFRHLNTTGVLQLSLSTNGTTQTSVTNSTVGVPDDGARRWVRVTRTTSDGVVTFYTSPDGVTWTQLGATAIAEAGVAPAASTTPLAVGIFGISAIPGEGEFYRAEWRNGINGTVVASPDFTDRTAVAAPFQTFADAQGNIWTINRSTTGLKAEIVNSSRFALGTDDYMEVADHADLNPGSGPFTFSCLVRVYNATPPVEIIGGKRIAGLTAPGFAIWRDIDGSVRARISDGTNSATAQGAAASFPRGVDTLLTLTRNGSALRLLVDGVEVATADASTVGSLTNTEVLRFGRRSGAGTDYANMTMRGAAWTKGRALSAKEQRAVKRFLEAS